MGNPVNLRSDPSEFLFDKLGSYLLTLICNFVSTSPWAKDRHFN